MEKEKYEHSKLQEHDKKTLLGVCDFKREKGFCMDYEMPDEFTNIFITEKEWIKKTLAGSTEYFWNSNYDRMMDFDEAWECLEEDLWDEFDVDNFKDFDKCCFERIQKQNKK